MTEPLLVSFAGGSSGEWQVDRIDAVAGASLPQVGRLTVYEGPQGAPDARSTCARPTWLLRGITSNVRYTNRVEADRLVSRQQGLGRSGATRAALIPIRKTAAWWALAQDERRAIFEEQSRHIGIGLDYLPAVARRLHHSRELGEPFDFLTWFEFAPEHAPLFDDLVKRLRETKEWTYIDREVDIRLVRG